MRVCGLHRRWRGVLGEPLADAPLGSTTNVTPDAGPMAMRRENGFDDRVGRCSAERPGSLAAILERVVRERPDAEALVADGIRFGWRELHHAARFALTILCALSCMHVLKWPVAAAIVFAYAVVAPLGHIFLTRLRPGWHVTSIGGSRRSAHHAGIAVRRTEADGAAFKTPVIRHRRQAAGHRSLVRPALWP